MGGGGSGGGAGSRRGGLAGGFGGRGGGGVWVSGAALVGRVAAVGGLKPVSAAAAAMVRVVVRASAWRFSRERGSSSPSMVLWGRAAAWMRDRSSSAFSLAR